MSTQFLKTRVPAQTKALVQAAAERQLLTESVWLRRVVDEALREDPRATDERGRDPFRDGRSGGRDVSTQGVRFMIRMRREDRLLLRERAAARGMAGATYVSVVMRAHLRRLSPLPKEELAALKRAVAELGAIGRNLNQIARGMNHGTRPDGSTREDLRTFLKVCEALRDHVRELIKANSNSWEVGYAETEP